MNYLPPELVRHLETILLIVVAALGSTLGYISKQWGAGKVIKVSRVVFSVASSVFFLILLRALANKLNLDYEWTLILVGLCSWMGVEFTASLIERALQRLLGVIPIYVKANEASNRAAIRPGSVCDVAELSKHEDAAKATN